MLDAAGKFPPHPLRVVGLDDRLLRLILGLGLLLLLWRRLLLILGLCRGHGLLLRGILGVRLLLVLGLGMLLRLILGLGLLMLWRRLLLVMRLGSRLIGRDRLLVGLTGVAVPLLILLYITQRIRTRGAFVHIIISNRLSIWGEIRTGIKTYCVFFSDKGQGTSGF